MVAHRLTAAVIHARSDLDQLLGPPAQLTQEKVSPTLNELTRQFIDASPFVCLATSDAAGNCDVSPRGDPRGFVRALDRATLLIPERPGNRLADSLRNILANPRVGLLFFVPGVGDTLRVNGRATLTTDVALLEPCTIEGKAPRLGILVDIEAVFTHCSKAFLRSRLWDPDQHIERSALPTNGQIHRLLKNGAFDAETHDAERAERYARREGFY